MARYAVRLLAPLVLAAVAVGVYVIVDANVGSSSHHSATTVRDAPRRTGRHHRHRAAKPAFYTVRPGDTLSAISSHTGVGLDRLTALNPSLQPPYALSSGQRLRLRR